MCLRVRAWGRGVCQSQTFLGPFINPFPHGDDQLRVPLPCWLGESHVGLGWPSALDSCLLWRTVLPHVLRAAQTRASTHSLSPSTLNCMAGPGLVILLLPHIFSLQGKQVDALGIKR